jgi:HEPN domain-containing protein
MDRNEELINTRYDALMFAQTPEAAKRAAKALIEAVLGDLSAEMPLEEGLRQVCRKIRPATDARDQARFEAEFIELAMAPSGLQGVGEAVGQSAAASPTQSRKRAA